jgi:curved DNA-binding protein CbpA
MNGQLSQKPLVELMREISSKSMGGRLHLEHDRVKVAAYFDSGKFLYAASNVRTLRLREYLLKGNLVSEQDLTQFNDRVSDSDLVKVLCAQKLLTQSAAVEVQAKQVSDVLRLALLWTEGTWDFDPKSHLKETLHLNIDVDSLLLEAERRLPAKSVVPEPIHAEQTEVDLNQARNFIERVKRAQTYYEVLSVNWDVTVEDLKTAYYQLARLYHPDRFRKAHPFIVPHLETAFARLTQAYDTLRDDNLRANYNSKLKARRKAQEIANATAKPATAQPAAPQEASTESVGETAPSKAERAAIQFKEGLAALELGERKAALGLFASAASAVPNEAQYRAFYGHLLAGNERTRRAAEAELQAAIKLDPKNAKYRVMLAELYRDLGLKLRAKGEAERAVAADPNNQKARELLRDLK